jgi:replication-associated recombination protein RarA
MLCRIRSGARGSPMQAASRSAIPSRRSTSRSASRPPSLVGPPGIGKTRFARRLAATLDLRFAATSLAGVSDARALEGASKVWG